MTNEASTESLLASIDKKLDALLALTAFGLTEGNENLPRSSFSSLDSLLAASGP
jgi:hypothetical protein